MEAALEKFRDGQTIMFGDWHGELSAEEIITGLLDKGVKDIRAIAVSGGMPDQGLGRLINEHRVKNLITTHIGLNPVAGQQMFAGELEVEFVPQGTFAERIRCGGAGLGGVLTPTGIGTDVERGKQRLIIDRSGHQQLYGLRRRHCDRGGGGAGGGWGAGPRRDRCARPCHRYGVRPPGRKEAHLSHVEEGHGQGGGQSGGRR